MKWNPDKNNSNKHDVVSKLQDNNQSYKIANGNKQEEEWNDPKTPRKKGSFLHKHSMDDNFFIRSPSLLSRTTSRRSHTPTPRLHSKSSRSTDMIDFLKRSISRRVVTSPTPVEPSIDKLSKLTSQNNKNAPFSIDGISRSKSQRSTTPIIFSQSTIRKKPQHVEKKLECSLEELCFGAIKKIKIVRDVISDVGIIVQKEETLQIEVKPGWRKGTTITFEGKGDEKPGYRPADIVFFIDEKRHPLYKRVGDDLELGVEVPLLKALVGCDITLPLLGGGKRVLRVDDVIFPGYEKIIKDQGMPRSKEDGQRGDLRIRFIIDFPKQLSDDKCSKICSILESCI